MQEKRKAKIVTSFRFTWFTLDLLKQMVNFTGKSGADIAEEALAEFYKNHPEYHAAATAKDNDS